MSKTRQRKTRPSTDPHRTFQDAVYALAAGADVVPTSTDVVQEQEDLETAAMDAFMATSDWRWSGNGQPLASYQALRQRIDDAEAQLSTALPEAMQRVLRDMSDDYTTKYFIDASFHYELGVAIGRRLAGGVR